MRRDLSSPDQGGEPLGRMVLPETPVGPLTLVASERGLREIRFGLPSGPDSGVVSVPGEGASARIVDHLESGRKAVVAALGPEAAGGPGEAPLVPFDLSGHTPFRQAVWSVLLRIPRGEVLSYGEVTRLAGQGSPRAVGQAVGANPLPILVPCHRVVTGDGRLGGFSGGLERKVILLQIEGVESTGVRFDAPLGNRAQASLAF